MNSKEVVAGMRTELLDMMVTTHAQLIGSLMPTQRFVISDVEIDGDDTTLYGEIIQEEVN